MRHLDETTGASTRDAALAQAAFDPSRRAALGRIGVLAGLGTLGTATRAFAATAPVDDGAAFDANAALRSWLKPFKGVDDRDPAATDLRCESLAVTGRWPQALTGRFWRNGPAVFERAGQRYRHWFDGDGMVQRFTVLPRGVSHLGRLVRTSKLVDEEKAGRFLYPTFGTRIESDVPLSGPDAMNVANTNALEHAGRVLAMWEGGSAFALDPKDLSMLGPVTWKEGFEQVPFSAHPKLDPKTGALWNMGTFGDRIVVWQVDAAGRLASVQVRPSPYPNGMVHDMAMTERFVVLPLPPIRMDYRGIAEGQAPELAFRFEANEPLRVLVMDKSDASKGRVFELPARALFHVGNAFETKDGAIELSFVGSTDVEFLVHGATDLVAGRPSRGAHSWLHVARLDLASGRATLRELPGGIEFPRIDPRRIGQKQRFVVAATSWRERKDHNGLFHGLARIDTRSGRVDRFDHGDDAIVEEHVVVPKPGARGEADAWLVGTVRDAKRGTTSLDVFEMASLAAGPVARAALPYGLPLGFHGNFTFA